MPIPSPQKPQSKKEFIASCMSDSTMKSEFSDEKQRAAVCYSKWEDKESKAAIVIDDGEDKLIIETKTPKHMKKTIVFSSDEIAKAALEDAKNFKLSAQYAEGTKNTLEITASYPEGAETEKASCCGGCSDVAYELKWLREDYNYLSRAFYDHMKGHLPKINDVGKMKEAIKALGLEDSYDVAKPTIYVEY